MPPAARLSQSFAQRIEADGRTVYYLHASLPGFGLRVTKAGAKAWVYQWSDGSLRPRLTLGRFPAMHFAAAEELARECYVAQRRGDDPRAVLKRGQSGAPTMKAWCDDYLAGRLARYGAKPLARTTLSDHDQLISLYIAPHLGRLRLDRIEHGDVAALVEAVPGEAVARAAERKRTTVSGYRTAGKVRDLVAKLLKLAEHPDARHREPGTNPATYIPRTKGGSRQRRLKPKELARLFRALDALEAKAPVAIAAIKVLGLTGARRREVTAATVEEFDAAERVIRKRAHKTARL